jgi:predicted ATP-dependent serine protease
MLCSQCCSPACGTHREVHESAFSHILHHREPSTDLAIALAVASSYYNRGVPKMMAVVGEMGLAGELRYVQYSFTYALAPGHALRSYVPYIGSVPWRGSIRRYLTDNSRQVGHLERRLAEAAKLGFTQVARLIASSTTATHASVLTECVQLRVVICARGTM